MRDHLCQFGLFFNCRELFEAFANLNDSVVLVWEGAHRLKDRQELIDFAEGQWLKVERPTPSTLRDLDEKRLLAGRHVDGEQLLIRGATSRNVRLTDLLAVVPDHQAIIAAG